MNKDQIIKTLQNENKKYYTQFFVMPIFILLNIYVCLYNIRIIYKMYSLLRYHTMGYCLISAIIDSEI